MKKYSWILGLFIMILCIAFGILLPRFVFSKTLSQSLKRVEEYEIEPVEMGHSNTVIHAMRSCSNSEYSFDYQEEMADLTREQLKKICNSFLTELKLQEWGYHDFTVNESNMKATCHLEVMNYDEKYRIKTTDAASGSISSYEVESKISNTDSERNTAISTVIWNVEVEYSPNCIIVIKVDDKNQKVVQIIDYARKYSKDGDVAYTELAFIEPYVSKIILPFFRDYYDADVEIMECDYWNCTIQMVDKNNEEIILSLQISDGLLQMITYDQRVISGMEEQQVQRWLMENSWRYGFILRYPEEKSDITGIVYEPWHYRYVGYEAAKYIYENEMTLEEYIAEGNSMT